MDNIGNIASYVSRLERIERICTDKCRKCGEINWLDFSVGERIETIVTNPIYIDGKRLGLYIYSHIGHHRVIIFDWDGEYYGSAIVDDTEEELLEPIKNGKIKFKKIEDGEIVIDRSMIDMP